MNSNKQISDNIIGFDNEIESINQTIADFESGIKSNIAIISEPFSGRTTLIRHIEKMNPYHIEMLELPSIVKNKDEILKLKHNKRIIIIDNCHFLYMRKIGGFAVLEEFLRTAAASSDLFITTWNIHSWEYLNKVFHLENFFPVQIKLPKLDKKDITELILSGYADEIIFIEDDISEEKNIIRTLKYPVTLKPFKKTIDVPLMTLDLRLLRSKLSKKEEKIKVEDLIFEIILNISNGNPGVTKAVWEKSLQYPAIKPSYIEEFSKKIDLNINESFMLSNILSMESIGKDDLFEITGEIMIDEMLYKLSQLQLITTDGGFCSIRPELLKNITEYLKKTRLV